MNKEIIDVFLEIYNRFRLEFYRNLNQGEGDDALTVSESFCLEVINGLDYATVRDVAAFMNISQPNAAYKISNLEDKEYITKTQSKDDKRVFHLNVTDKYYDFVEKKNANVVAILEKSLANVDEDVLNQSLDLLKKFNNLLPATGEYLDK